LNTLTYKEIISAIAIVLTLVAFLPYVLAIISGRTKPHVFSWIIWGSTTFVVFLAQVEAKGGVGAWPIGISGIITLWIALLAYLKRADISITKIDWLFFVSALSSLPLWYLSADPLWAVIVLTVVDILGFAPTLRKAYYAPYTEPLLFYALFAVRNMLVILALEFYSVTTVLFPAAIAIACVALMLVITIRREHLSIKK